MSTKYLGHTDNGTQYTLGQELSAQINVTGAEFTPTQAIIAALVRRLGGSVTLQPSEIIAASGVCIESDGPGSPVTITS